MENLKPFTKIQGIDYSYTLEDCIGSGSYGEVWRATNDFDGTEVAIKFYIMLDEKGREEFMSEYEIAQGLSHPNLLTASFIGTWKNRPFLVMKFCPNGSSSNIIGKLHPCPEDEKILWKFILDVASGLAYLHGIEPDPIVHQDIKPDNILQDEYGNFVITDFGISKKIRSTMRSQSSRAIKAGAVAYMGPERFSSQPAPIKASDIWSLGASIYELAMGELPFCGQGGNMLRNGADMPTLEPGWSKDLETTIHRCLAKEPWNRIKAYELVDLAKTMLEEGPVKKVKEKIVIPPVVFKGVAAGIAAIAACAGIILSLNLTADKREAKSHVKDYLALVSECSQNISSGDNSHYLPLIEAKQQVEEIKKYDDSYSQSLPDVFNSYEDLDNKLMSKLIGASEAWAKAANSQVIIGNEDKALDYYVLANELYPVTSSFKLLEQLAETNAYMKVTDIQFQENKKASELQNIVANVIYEGLSPETKIVNLNAKIYDPSGNTLSFSVPDCPVHFGKGNNFRLSDETSENVMYVPGTYCLELWHNQQKIYNKTFTLY